MKHRNEKGYSNYCAGCGSLFSEENPCWDDCSYDHAGLHLGGICQRCTTVQGYMTRPTFAQVQQWIMDLVGEAHSLNKQLEERRIDSYFYKGRIEYIERSIGRLEIKLARMSGAA